ncbi:MAG TPA: GtrA family protein, partial [Ferruginibacter sp.]|nr:GtrA family protein [Ferruginibacter sp.]
MAKRAIIQFIDLFYPPFRRFMPEQTFRYAACGGANTVLGLVLFKILLVYVFKFQNVDLGFYTLKPHNAALFISFIVNFIVGFALMKYIVFLDSNLRGRIQLFRYGLAFLFNLALNYFILKVFVEVFGWWPFLSQCITTAIIRNSLSGGLLL